VAEATRCPVRKIAVYRSGLLGDTLAALPALWSLKENFPEAKLIYIWQRVPNASLVTAKEVLDGSGLVDQFIMDELAGTTAKRARRLLKLFRQVVSERIDVGIVLEAPFWSNRRRWFLEACGVKRVVGGNGRMPRIRRDANGEVVRVPHISDQLLGLLVELEVQTPEPQTGRMELPLSGEEQHRSEEWLSQNELTEVAENLIAVAPWSNMAAKRWPLGNFSAAVKQLVSEFDVTPIVFGGKDERDLGRKLVEEWGTGAVAAGELNVREGTGLMGHCRLYLGNDTGAMHMAAASGIPCVAVFSARDSIGLWEPYGARHSVLRERVDCEGCLRRACPRRAMECMGAIGVGEVVAECRRHLLTPA